MHQFRQIISRMRLDQSDRDIARAEGVGRKTVAKVRLAAQSQGWTDQAVPLPDDAMLAACFSQRTARPQTVSSVEMFRNQIVKWHSEAIQGTTIHAALVRKYQYSGSYSAVRLFLQSLGGPTIEASVILDLAPGEAAQVDFGAGPKIVDPETGEIINTWFFVMTLAWSRHQYIEFVRDQTVATWLQCHRHALEFFNGVPTKMIIDNPKCAITRACIYEPTVQRSYAELAKGYGLALLHGSG